MTIQWTGYLKYRAVLRGFDLNEIEQIIRFSEERYLDSDTGRRVVVGHHHRQLVLIPYDQDGDTVTPVTVHATTRQQVNIRLRVGRLRHE